MALHRNITGDDIHVVHTWTYADETARLAADSFVEGDVGKIALQESDATFWILTDYSTPDWTQLGGAGTASGAIYTWTYADTATREAATGFSASDVGKVAWQLDDDTFWMLSDDDPIAWVQIGGGSTTSVNPLYYIEVW